MVGRDEREPLRYPMPAGTSRIEFTEKNSRFIGTAGPASTVEEAKAFIERVANEFADASHNVWAYLVGFGPRAVWACHNAGEPGGTAGPPVLAVLQGSGLGDVVVVVTRYFGGIKLGPGGLVRAYSRAAREAVAALPRGEKVAKMNLSITLEYRFYERLQRLLKPLEAQIERAQYGPRSVELDVHIPYDRVEEFIQAVREVTSGQAGVQLH